ncbi:MAG: SRPBCC domain-containing protein [Bacteroidia bacterium]|jgi:hypothetical protein|nr:SRPBCC domain-containing protein [Bacteroidia bacterium]
MSTKIKFELEYLFKVSIKVLENSVSTPAGLAEWFADDVNVKEDVYTFVWNKSEEKARLKQKKTSSFVRFKWLNDEEEGNDVYFEFNYALDPLTKSLVFKVVDFADEDDLKEAKHLWDSQIQELKRHLGA